LAQLALQSPQQLGLLVLLLRQGLLVQRWVRQVRLHRKPQVLRLLPSSRTGEENCGDSTDVSGTLLYSWLSMVTFALP
jgi:hypothetical protein